MNALINGQTVVFEQGETILQACRRNGIFVPTLCEYARLNHHPGTCRVCLVEVVFPDGTHKIVTSCNTILTEGMQVLTNSPETIRRRRLQVELLLADHQMNCASCSRHGRCELIEVARAVGADTSRFHCRLAGQRAPMDATSSGIVLDAGKCIRCGRCVEACRQIQGLNVLALKGEGTYCGAGPADAPTWIQSDRCVTCGQCTLVCPVGALAPRSAVDQVCSYLADPKIKTVFQFAPAVRVVLPAELGIAGADDLTGRIVASIKAMGADIVSDTNFAADVTIMEEGTELIERLTKGGKLPMFTSCCPGWINFAEKIRPGILPHLSTARSPQQIFGSLAKTYLAQKKGIAPENMRVVSIMPCTAKKGEAARPEFAKNGQPDVDAVITVREFADLLARFGINPMKLEPVAHDDPFMSEGTGAAVIFGTTGGVMEAALRTVYRVVTGKEMPMLEFEPVRGMDYLKEASIDFGGSVGVLKVAVAHTLRTAVKVVDEVLAGKSPYTFIEVMACPGGCVGGGGTPRRQQDADLRTRQQGLYQIDRNSKLRGSHMNPQVVALYDSFLGKPCSHLAHELLHTETYVDRKAEPSAKLQELWKDVKLV